MIYDQFGIDARREYDLFIFALTGRYLAVLTPGVAVTPAAVQTLEAGGQKLRSTYLQTASRMIDEYAAEFPSNNTQALTAAWKEKLARFTAENISTLAMRLKGSARSEFSMLTNLHGGMGALMQQKLTEPQYEITTASGRRFKASPLVETEARDFAYKVWLYSTTERIAKQSDLAEVTYASADHEGSGQVFSISGKDERYPSFQNLLNSTFHYNATAMVRQHVST